MLDDRYKGKIAWFDDLNQLVWAGYYLGFKKPYDQTDAELKKSQALLKSKKGNVRMFWSSETDLQNAFASGRRLDRLCLARRLHGDEGEEAARRLHAAQGRCALVGLRPHARQGLAARPGGPRLCRRVELDDRSASWLETNYAYGSANTKARPADAGLARALQLDNPKSVSEPFAHIDRYIPRRSVYSKLWDEVKAS